MHEDLSKEVNKQKTQVESNDFYMRIVAACTIDSGIIIDQGDDVKVIEEKWAGESLDIALFVPASGSGSRMFKVLYEMIDGEEENSEIDNFFASFNSLPISAKIDGSERKEIAHQLIQEYASKPKGLIPFHRVGDRDLCPFQEHLLQAKNIVNKGCKVHFTIQQEFEDEINSKINEIKDEIEGITVEFSYQDIKTDAFCFNENGDQIFIEEKPLRRPAGHGALIYNLNNLDADTILIKNIDNIQHSNYAKSAELEWKKTVLLLHKFKDELADLCSDFSEAKANAFNQKYQLFKLGDETKLTLDLFQSMSKRPSRVCGMVKNEGAPGGGPFWVDSNNSISKQIVEKAQISESNNQQNIIKASSHFNPVFIAISKTDTRGNRLDLIEFVDDSAFFVVNKTHEGRDIKYRELPGLWNGAMSKWNTLFVEIPSELFSPVKSVLDLNSPLHKA